MIINIPSNGLLLIRKNVLEKLYGQRQTGMEPESGGILLGSYRGEHFEIVDATLPGIQDIRRPREFIRNCNIHQKQATKAWRESNGSVTYIGEWHTHPISSPDPSYIDLHEWINKLPNRNMILLIQGTKYICACMQIVEHKSKKIINLGLFVSCQT